MTEREKIAHLLRRFAFGASAWELDEYAKLGYAGALDRLLNYDSVDEGFPVKVWEVCLEPGMEEIYVDAFRFSGWWSLRMLMSRRPLEQKLTLFWHDHFAVGADKVEFGPAMHGYIETLRKNAAGKFGDLLLAVSREPAMLRYLDTDQSFRGQPNENFARELLELFTMGHGTYTEKDVDEASRCFTGWGNRYLVFESGGENVQARIRECIEKDRPMIAFAFSPELHDSGSKTILGQSKAYSGEGLLAELADRPETAEHISLKLWEHFAYEKPEKAVVQRLGKKFRDTDGNVRAVLREMVETPEFWSERCVRKQIKSPVDFVVGIIRALNVNAILLGLRGQPKDALSPLAKPLRDTAGLLVGSMYQQGMLPLFPPDVGGWEWGKAWISTANMLHRMRFGGLIMGEGQPSQPLAAYLGQTLLQRQAKTSKDLAAGLMAIFDAELPDEKVKLVEEAIEKNGGMVALRDQKSASVALGAALKLMFGSPEFQHF